MTDCTVYWPVPLACPQMCAMIVAERLSARQLILHHVGPRLLYVYIYIYNATEACRCAMFPSIRIIYIYIYIYNIMYVTLDPWGHGGG